MATPLHNDTTGRATAVPIRKLQSRAPLTTATPAKVGSEHGYNYEGDSRLGHKFKLYINVPDEMQAGAELENSGLNVLDLTVRRRSGRQRNGIPSRVELAQLAEQIGDQVESGEPMPNVCQMIGRNSGNKVLATALMGAEEEIRQGKSTAEAFASQMYVKGKVKSYSTLEAEETAKALPVFPITLVHGVKIAEDTGAIKDPITGESVGAMQVMMQRFANDQIKADGIISQIRGAMMYPAGITGVTFVIIAIMLYVVVPKLVEIYASISPDAKLPLPTRIIVGASDLLVTPYGGAAVVLAGVGVFLGIKWIRGPVGADWLARRNIFWPVFGSLLRDYHATTVLRNMAMLSSGQSDLKAVLGECAKATANPVYREMLETALDQFIEKSPTFDVLFRPYAKLMGDEFHTVLLTLEKTGRLDKLFLRYAAVMEKRVDRKVKVLTHIMENYLIIPVGIFIGGVVISLYLPLFDMLGKMAAAH